MKEFMLSFLSTALTMSVVIGVLLILSKILKNKFTAACRYVIWAVIIVRLAFPVGLFGSHSIIKVALPYTPPADNVEIGEEEFPLELHETEYIGNNTVQPAVTAPVSDSKPPVQGGNIQGNISMPDNDIPATPVPDTPKQPSESTGNETVIPAEPEKKTIDTDMLVRILFTVWLAGAVAFFAINMGKYILFAIKLRKTSRRVTDMDLALRYVDVCNGMKVYNAPYLYISDTVNSPLLYGYLRPCAVLPADISNEGLEYIFTHEIIHFKRGDIWLKLVALISNSLYWFNPLVYWAVRELNDEIELSCDEKALKGLGEEERIAYSRVLLEAAGKCKKRKIGLTTAFDSKESKIKSRINSILDATKKRKGTVIIIAVLIICIAAGMIIGFSFKKDEQEPQPPEETTDLTAEGWKECETTDKYDGIDIVEKFMEYGFDYRSSDKLLPCILADTRSCDVIFYDGKKSYIVTLDSTYRANAQFSVKLCNLSDDGKKDAVISFVEQLYAIKTVGDKVYYKHSGDTKQIIEQFKNNFKYYYSPETKTLSYFDGDRAMGKDDLNMLVSVMGADFSHFEFNNGIIYYADEDNVRVTASLTPVYADGKSSKTEFSFSISSFIGYGALGNPKISTITHTRSINVTADMLHRYDYSKNPNYVTLSTANTSYGETVLYGERTGYNLVIKLKRDNYILPIKWKNVQPLNLHVDFSKASEGRYFIIFYNSIEELRIHHVQIDEKNKYADIKTIEYDDLREMVDKRFSYSYDKEESIISYLSDGVVSRSDYLGRIVEKYGKHFESFEYSLGTWKKDSFGQNLGTLELYPKLEDGTVVENDYKMVLNLNLYYNSISRKIGLNPITFQIKTAEGMLPDKISEFVKIAENIEYPFDSTKYLREEERYVKLRSYDDGTGLFGKYGGKQMLYYVSENDYYHINMAWIINGSMLGFASRKSDLDGNGRSEPFIDVSDKFYVVDKVNGSYTMFSYEKDDALDEFNKSFSYKYDRNTKTVILYNNGIETSRLNFGNKLLSPDDFLGFNKPSKPSIQVIDKDNYLSGYISFTWIFVEGKGYYNELARVTSHVVIKYSPERGLYFGGLEDLYLETNGRDGDLHNAKLYSNSDYWTLRSDEEFFLHIDGKNGEHFSYPNLIHLHYSTWVGPVYEPNGDEEPIVWGLYSDYAPRLYVFDDGMRGIITYLCANVNQGYGRIERAVIVDLVDGKILHDGGMTERMMFDAHGISEEIRRKYHFISQAMPKQYDITFSLKEVSPSIIRFENSIISFDGNMILKGYTDYNVDTWEVSDYVITENTVR